MRILDAARFWNVTPDEIEADYPAHRHATAPYVTFLRAVDVAASPAVVFRWLCQLKVAPYSYDWIDNRARRSPRRLTPGVERLATGQRLIVVDIVEFAPDQHITGISTPAATALFGKFSLTYQVLPAPGGSRLVGCIDITARSRAERLRTALLGVGDLVMMRKQLLTLKRLAERPRAPAGESAPSRPDRPGRTPRSR